MQDGGPEVYSPKDLVRTRDSGQRSREQLQGKKLVRGEKKDKCLKEEKEPHTIFKHGQVLVWANFKNCKICLPIRC
jgi:hypothetical protein